MRNKNDENDDNNNNNGMMMVHGAKQYNEETHSMKSHEIRRMGIRFKFPSDIIQ